MTVLQAVTGLHPDPNITPIWDRISVKWALIALCVIQLITLSVLFYSKKKTKQSVPFSTILLSLVPMIIMVPFIMTLLIGKQHGLYTLNLNFRQLTKGIERSPEEDRLPKSLDNKIFILYRFGCSDCEQIYPELAPIVAKYKQTNDIYYVSSRSTFGQKLVNDYAIEFVPTALYVRNAVRNPNDKITDLAPHVDPNDFVKKDLIYVDPGDSGQGSFHPEDFERLIQLQNEERNENK